MSVVFYVPGLHPEFMRNPLPPRVACINAGLPRSVTSPPLLPAEAVFTAALPLTPAQARATLAEMLTLGENVPMESLRRMENPAEQDKNTTYSLPQDERAALESFINDGPTETPVMPAAWLQSARPTADQIHRALVECQKVLLLAHYLEERQQEIRNLEATFAQAEGTLQTFLKEGSGSELVEESTPEPMSEACPWRMIVDAALSFLPEGSLLFTDNPDMTSDLRAAGMLQPLPEDTGAACADWPVELTAGLLWVKLPAWRLVGRRGPQQERPWLEQQIEILVARPQGGWMAGQ